MSHHRPNIILIMTDQQRVDTIRAWGYDHMITPAQDRIAGEGVSFRRTYCPGATCVASRAAIFTGMYPHNTGVYSFNPWGDHRNWIQDLADSGYWCANIGKMHFVPRDVPGGFHERVIVENPTNVNLASGGADDDWGRYMTFHGVQRPNDRHKTDPDWWNKLQGVPWHEEEKFHSDVFIGNAALNWIRNHRGEKPFFLEVGFTGPHEPWDPLPRHLDLYKDTPMPKPVARENELAEKPRQHEALKKMFSGDGHESCINMYLANDERIDHMRRHYYAKVTTVDEKIGEILDALEERGYMENTLLIFCSDHGENLGDHTIAYKWLMYDSVTNIPLIIRYPDRARQGEQVHDLVSLMDLGPTILDAAGVPVPTYLEGRSLMPYAPATRDINPRKYVFCEDNYQIMMRSQTHKMVYYIGQEEGELYDLEADPGELWNRWSEEAYSEIKSALKNDLLEWLAASNYWHAGYKRDRSSQYTMRWPTKDNCNLQGPSAQDAQPPHL